MPGLIQRYWPWCLLAAPGLLTPVLTGESAVLRFDAGRGVVVLAGVASPDAAALHVFVDSGGEVPPLLGSTSLRDGSLVFDPKYSFQPGLSYRAEYRPLGLSLRFAIPRREMEPSTVVEEVYPTTSTLPENQLKLYIHFSAPMSRREAERRIHLLTDAGGEVSAPFLELAEELWDNEGQRLTILFDPGRIKRGLVPNEEVGPALEAGRQYTLVIDREWPDARGLPMREPFRKVFTAAPADRTPPTLKTWRVSPPVAGSRDPLAVEFPEPLDHALLLRLIHIVTKTEAPVSGTGATARNETVWQFVPDQPWAAGSYWIEVGTILEDLAGNSLDRPFEVDLFEKVEERVQHVTQRLAFEVSARGQ